MIQLVQIEFHASVNHLTRLVHKLRQHALVEKAEQMHLK